MKNDTLLIPDKPLTGAHAAQAAEHVNGLRMLAKAKLTPPEQRGVEKSHRVKMAEAVALFSNLALRASVIDPGGRGQELKEYFEGCIEDLESEEVMRTRAEVLDAARGGDQEAITQRQEAVMTSVRNLMLADMGWANFFEMRDLADGDWPVYEVDVPQEMTVEAIGQDGEPQVVQAILDKKQYPIPLSTIFTEWFEYDIRDLYRGSAVRDISLQQVDLARDFGYAIDALLASYVLVGGANSRLTATFDTTNADKKLRDYIAHSRVHTANFPAGNLVTLGTNSTTTNFRKEVLDAALEYCERWGSDVDGSGPLNVVEIRVCSKDVGAWRGQVTLTSEMNSLTSQIFDTGVVMNYAGKRFIVVGDNTINPNDGVAYFRLSKPIGMQFEKTSFADVIIDESAELRKKNKGRMCQGSAFGWALPLPLRKNVLGVRYRTPI